MDEQKAEAMKLKYASAYTDNSKIDNTLMYPIDAERSVESHVFIEIVEARLQEIIENVWCQVPVEYVDRLLGGIILTGGGSNMKNIETAFRNHTSISKIRVAGFVTQKITSNNPDITAHNGMMNTVLAILAKGDMNCAGEESSSHTDLFGADKTQKGLKTADVHDTPRSVHEIETGVVLTEAEKLKAEELRRKAAEEKAKKEEEEEQARLEEEKKNKKKKGFGHLFNKAKEFIKKSVTEDE